MTKMMSNLLTLLFTILLFDNTFAIGKSSFPKEYYISIEGSDEWDGTASENIPFTNTGPWLTIQNAITQLKNIRGYNPGPEDHVTVNIMSGTYYQESTVKLAIHDSYIDFVSTNDAIISAGYSANFTWNKQGNVLSTRFVGSCPHEAYSGNYRLLPARSPNIDWTVNKNLAMEPYHIINDLLAESNTCHRESNSYSQSCPYIDKTGFIADSNDVSKDWSYLDQTYVLIFHSWIAEYAKIANIEDLDDGTKKVKFQNPLQHAAVGDYNKPGGWRYLLFNNLALLDSPGEYVCVQENDEAVFSYIPPLEEDDTSSSYPIFSNLEVIIELNRATNINFKGVKFQHSSSGGHDGYNFGPQSAFRILNTENINIKECEFSHTGMIAAWIYNSNQITIQNNIFFDIGYHGVHMLYKDTDHDIMDNVMIRNNLFDGCGISRFWQPGCLWTGGRFNISVVNNEITNTPYMGMAIMGNYPHGDKYWSENGVTDPTREDYIFHVEFNYFHNIGNGILTDFGAVYVGASGQVSCNTAPEKDVRKYCYSYAHVYNNLITGTQPFHGDYSVSLYSDEAVCRATFENNIVYGSGGSPIHHHCGLDNVAKNNYIHRKAGISSPPKTMWAGCAKESPYQSYSNFHNIYLLDNADDFKFSERYYRFYNQAPDFYQNIYWSKQMEDQNLPMFPDQLTWNEWIQTGNDSNSLWIDPGFQNPDTGDYVLGENSPAWDLGIKQIQLDNFGVQISKSHP